MFDEPGIGAEELAWIQRDQFVYYLEMAHALGDPHNWTQFREDLIEALTAAFTLDTTRPDTNGTPAMLTTGQRVAGELLDQIRARHDPADDWPRFLQTLWDHRRDLRADL